MAAMSSERFATRRPFVMVMCLALFGALHQTDAWNAVHVAAASAAGHAPRPAAAAVVPPAADLSVRIRTEPVGTAWPLDAVGLYVHVENQGPADASQATIRIALPTGLVYEGVDMPPHITCTTPAVGEHGLLECRGASSAGVQDLVVVRTTMATPLAPGARVTAVATVASELSDPAPDDNVARAELRTPLRDLADLWIEHDLHDGRLPALVVGHSFTEWFLLGNNGDATAAGTRMTFNLSASLRLDAIELDADSCSGNVCTLGDLMPGQKVPVSARMTVVAPGPTDVEVVVTSTTPDIVNATNRTESHGVAALPAEAALGVTLRGPATLAIGGEGTLAVTVTDAGPSAPVSPLLRLDLPAGLTVTGVEGCASIDPCPLTFAPDQHQQTVRVLVLVADDYAGPATIDLRAEVASGNDSYVADNVATLPMPIAPPASADVRVTMQDSPDPVIVGETVTYLVTVVNRGPGVATGVTVVDALPGGLVASEAVPTSGSCDLGPPLRCALGDLPVGAPALIRLTAAAPLQDDTSVTTNRVSVTALSPDPEPADNEAEQSTTIVNPPAADVKLTLVSWRAASPDTVVPGETVVLTYLVENLGPEAAEAVTFHTESEGIVPVGIPEGCAEGSLSLPCDLGTLAPGTSATVVVTWRVPDADPLRAAFYLTLYAVAYGEETLDLRGTNNALQFAIPIWRGPADLRVTLNGPATAAPDETITYAIGLTNDAEGWARDVRLDLVVPPGVTVESSTGPCEARFPCTVGDFGAGATLNLTVTCRVAQTYANATLTAQAIAVSQTEDAQPADNSATSIASLTGQADIGVTMQVDEPRPDMGSQVRITIEARNHGPSDATGLVVTNSLPRGLKLASSSPSAGTFEPSSGQWQVGELASGAIERLVLDAQVVQSGALVATATTTELGQPDLVPDNNSAGVALNVASTADLAVRKVADRAEAAIGDTVTFVVEVHNHGPDRATEVVVADRLPRGLALLDAATSRGVYDPDSGDWTIAAIAADTMETLTVRARRDIDGPLTNRARIAQLREHDPTAANNGAGVTIGGSSLDIGVVATASETSAVIGQIVTFTIAATNYGPYAGDGLAVTSRLPDGLVFVAGLPSQGSYRADTGLWDIGTLSASGAEAHATLRISAAVSRAGLLTNTARLTATNLPDLNGLNDFSSAAVESQAVDLAAALTLTGDPVVAGSTVTLTMTATNVGATPHDAVVQLDVILPSSLTLAAGTAGAGLRCTVSGALARCASTSPVRLAPGERVAWPLAATVNGPSASGASATMTLSSPRDLHTANNITSVPIGAAGPSADLRLSALASVSATDEAFRIVYDVTIENAGPSASGEASLVSQVPPGTRVTRATSMDGAPCAVGPAVTCDLAPLLPGETRALRIEVVGTAGGLIVHHASVAGAIADPDLANNAIATVTAIDGGAFDADGDGMPTSCEAAYGTGLAQADSAEDPDGDGRTNLEECHDGTHPRGFYTRYFAEGASNAFFRTHVAYLNPDVTMPARVLTTLLGANGPIARTVTRLAPRTPFTLDPAEILSGEDRVFSAVIESDLPFVAERAMFWDSRGYGSSAQRAIDAPATEWYLAEGATGAFSLFYLLANPSPRDTADVTLRYLLPEGTPIERRLSLPPYSRTTIDVNAEADPALQASAVSAHIVATHPIIVERAMYRDGRDEIFGSGHGGAGATLPARSWSFAEGASGPFFDTFLLLANPGQEAGEARVTYALPGGETVVKRYSLPSESRVTVAVDGEDAPLAAATFGMLVEATVPIVAERAMWWPGPEASADVWYEGHVSLGSTMTASRWGLAGGAAGGAGAEQTFVLIANHGPAREVRVTVLFETGDARELIMPIAETSRRTVDVAAEFPEARDRRFSVLVEALGAEPAALTVEYARYATVDGRLWAAGMASLATPLP